MDNDILKLNKVSAYYDNNKGIKDISFEIKEGEFIGIIGHNGAGKTTLMNSILGLKDYTGVIYSKYRYNDIGYVCQKQVIDWYLNIEDNMYFEKMLLDKKRNEDDKKIESLLGLTKNLKTSIEELSGGQLQRVIVARCLLKYPKLYILDEPTTGLDALFSEKLLEYLLSLTKKGNTILISSHDLDLIEKYCKRIIVIKNGVIQYDGNTDEFCKNTTLKETILEDLRNE